MEVAATLAADLALLSAALYDPDADPMTDVADTVLGLATNARQAVGSFIGLTVTVTEPADRAPDQVALRFTLLDAHAEPGDIATTLRLPGLSDDKRPDRPHIAVFLYATTPGAFVDMAADLCFLTGNNLDAADLDQHHHLAREPDTTAPLQARTVTSEAVGVLIAGGRTREQAYAELDTLADAAHTHRAVEASRILNTLTRRQPPPTEPRNASRRPRTRTRRRPKGMAG